MIHVYKEASELGKILEKLDEIVGTKTSAKVAIIYDMQNRLPRISVRVREIAVSGIKNMSETYGFETSWNRCRCN